MKKILVKVFPIIRKVLWYLILLFIFLVLLSNTLVFFHSKGKIFEKTENIFPKKVGLVLGTAKYVGGNPGLRNLFYEERIKSANELFESGKVEFLILSGTHDREYYNEPESMKEDLMKLGVPENKLVLDYAGLRTLDSVLRTKEVFSQLDFIIISQKFHLQRAIAIASLNNISVVGYVAQNPPFSISVKTYFREVFSRIKFLLDIVTNKKAKFYGDEIEIK